ncbi:MAG: hypothetical protein KAS59_06665 [Alphaproteobacteria bacterium]|nr:hypothetical protein [Alphaproteobacteria bacterium]
MKKYLTFAFFLGVIAFTSVSYLAQADVAVSSAVAAEAVSAEIAVTPVISSDEAYTKDSVECHALASAPTSEGVVPSDEVKKATFKKCMIDKKYSEEDIAKGEVKNKEVTPPVAPEAPVAPKVPVEK